MAVLSRGWRNTTAALLAGLSFRLTTKILRIGKDKEQQIKIIMLAAVAQILTREAAVKLTRDSLREE